eukprot:352371-Chlamydomonas_euryale.AAC.6
MERRCCSILDERVVAQLQRVWVCETSVRRRRRGGQGALGGRQKGLQMASTLACAKGHKRARVRMPCTRPRPSRRAHTSLSACMPSACPRPRRHTHTSHSACMPSACPRPRRHTHTSHSACMASALCSSNGCLCATPHSSRITLFSRSESHASQSHASQSHASQSHASQMTASCAGSAMGRLLRGARAAGAAGRLCAWRRPRPRPWPCHS